MPCSVCNAPDGTQCNRTDCPANAALPFTAYPQNQGVIYVPGRRPGTGGIHVPDRLPSLTAAASCG
jgi:hypothetical protein